jgi:hypothetical protein
MFSLFVLTSLYSLCFICSRVSIVSFRSDTYNPPVLMSSPRKPFNATSRTANGSHPVVNLVTHHQQGVEEWEDSFRFRKPAWFAMLKSEQLPPWIGM